MTILIIDDHEENLYLLKSLLEGNGYEVVSAGNGIEALEELRNGGIGMIISDILMPGMDGFQLCRNVKADEAMQGIPFVVYTATYTDPQDESLAMKMGADRFIVKPCEPDVFMDIINDVIADTHTTRQCSGEKQSSDGEIFQLYSERLVKKLEDKVVETEQEIRRREETEKALHISLDEKTQLILELYHRTRNNMQVIISILNQYAGIYADEHVQTIIRNTVSRIQAMALVHEHLIKSKNLSSIDLDDYFRDFAVLLEKPRNSIPGKVKLSFNLEPVKTLIDIAVPCGLVLNELVFNALEHAFPDGRKGEIQIGLHRTMEDGIISMSVVDNGIGLPAGFDCRNSRTIGFPMIIALIEDQLQGKIVFGGEKGFSCVIQFRNNMYGTRI
ncbi:MAG: response regulator [Spirochaetales bacterium]|nr:response regulator [Spirochaetales bacterium]